MKEHWMVTVIIIHLVAIVFKIKKMNIKYKFNKDKLWFTADTHFYHENIIKYCNRPFKNVEEMNKVLIDNWNKVVKSGDDIIIAGDFIHSGNLELIHSLMDRLNGDKWLCYGNHDYQNKLERDEICRRFNYHCWDSMDFHIEDNKFHINHYPCEFWTRGAIHLHGHVHSGPKSISSEVCIKKSMRYDIGIDNNNYKPISYYEVIKKIK
jgi:calcineurin-like phosphoesterase family protein